jgi:cytochrome b6
MIFLRGGEEVTGATLSRFFGFHVAVLPGLTTLLVAIHLLLIQRFGISVPARIEPEWRALPQEKREMRFFPNFLLRELMAWYIALGVLGALAAFSPWGLGVKADPFAPAPAGIKPEWYFLFMFQTLKLIPAKLGVLDGEVVGILTFSLAGLIWLLVPFLDGTKRTQRLVTGAAMFVVTYMGTMTAYGYVAR